ncbi:hypothetical protein PIB30_087983 [Stylosanthes scabra]|uniref:Uncharacterized protein n=1 Tax=Stylosanthes scabra TaxID=79078 RepID=A0ABU6VTV9_9FABA|nr:hypothetical protein [Stylosanthes scabra]
MVSYAMTINKNQGKSLSRVGLMIKKLSFTHGQLYVVNLSHRHHLLKPQTQIIVLFCLHHCSVPGSSCHPSPPRVTFFASFSATDATFPYRLSSLLQKPQRLLSFASSSTSPFFVPCGFPVPLWFSSRISSPDPLLCLLPPTHHQIYSSEIPSSIGCSVQHRICSSASPQATHIPLRCQNVEEPQPHFMGLSSLLLVATVLCL